MNTQALTRRGFGFLAGGLAVAACSTTTATESTSSVPVPPATSGLRDAPGTVSVFPVPGSRTASPKTAIALRGTGLSAAATADITVTGSSSSLVAGRLVQHSDGGGVSFLPEKEFTAGETVTVKTSFAVHGRDSAGATRFMVATPATETTPPTTASTSTPQPSVTAFLSDPAVKTPVLSITTNTSPAAGLVALSAKGAGLPAQLMLLRSDGSLVWRREVSSKASANDFKAQTWKGRPVLTWWEGSQFAHGYGAGANHVIDASYQQVAIVHAANGYSADLHDFQLTDRGTALMTAYTNIRWDLRPYGGKANGIMLDSIVQEVDLATGLAIFEWHALDHISPALSYAGAPTDTTTAWDFFHVNSIDEGPQNSLLISSRHTCTLTTLDRATGDVIWKLGGKKSDFTSVGGTVSFFFQHDARWRPDGTITLFDDEGGPPRKATAARGLRLQLDTTKKTVKVVRAYAPTPAVASNSQGNADQLPNGNVIVGWGDQPQVTEFDPSGKVVWNALMPTGVSSYRAFRVDWTGTPTTVPLVALVSRASTHTVYASWNGDSRTTRWQLTGTLSGGAPKVLISAASGGYETALVAPSNATDLRVQALDASGKVLATVRVS